MGQLVEFPLESGGSVLVDVTGHHTGPVTLSAPRRTSPWRWHGGATQWANSPGSAGWRGRADGSARPPSCHARSDMPDGLVNLRGRLVAENSHYSPRNWPAHRLRIENRIAPVALDGPMSAGRGEPGSHNGDVAKRSVMASCGPARLG